MSKIREIMSAIKRNPGVNRVTVSPREHEELLDEAMSMNTLFTPRPEHLVLMACPVLVRT